MPTKAVMDYTKNLRDDEKIFLICDQCLWNVTCVNKLYLHKIIGTSYLCPVCNQDKLSSFPVKPDHSFRFTNPNKG